MIEEKNLIEIGKLLKPHGVKGEVTVLFNKPEFADIDTKFYFLFLDGMYVPFFIEEFMFNSDVTARIKFQNFNSIEQASTFANTAIFVPSEFVDALEPAEKVFDSEWDQFIGFTIIDESSSTIGVISGVDSATMNVLFIVVKDDEEILIPATEDFIVKIDSNEKCLYMKLPEGLLDTSFEE